MSGGRPARLAGVAYGLRGAPEREAARLEARGERVLRLNLGDPAAFGFDAPAGVLAALAADLGRAQGYSASQGLPGPRAAVAGYCLARGVPVSGPRDVYLGNGVSELIGQVLQALLDDADEVLVPSPDYPLWTAAARLVGARVVHYPCDEGADWLPDPAALAARITARTKAIVLINPNNPTGAVYPPELLMAILELARRHGLTVLSDEIYDQLVYDAVHVPTAALAPDVPCVTFNGLSKAYLLPGFRSGWIAVTGPPAATADLRASLDTLAGLRLCANVPGQLALGAALGGTETARSLVLPGGELRARRDALWQALAQLPGVSCVKPQGALYAFPRFDPGFWRTAMDEQFVLGLLRDERILVAHGAAFNRPGAAHLRLVTLPPPADLADAVHRIGRHLERLRTARSAA